MQKRISIVMQGVCDTYAINKNINFLKKHLPNCEIIISTWENSKGLEDLDKRYDKLILNKPLDDNYFFNGLPYTCNFHRMMKTSHEGIKAATSELVLRLRSDLLVKNLNFLKIYENHKEIENNGFFSHKVLILDPRVGCVYKNVFLPAPFYQFDWLTFGFKKDLLKIWDGVPDTESFHSEPLPVANFYNEQVLPYAIPAEVWLCKFIHKNKFIFCEPSKSNILMWEDIASKNFIFVRPSKFRIKTTKSIYKYVTRSFRFKKHNVLKVNDERSLRFFFKNCIK